MEGNCEYTK